MGKNKIENNHWKYELGSNYSSGYVSGETFGDALEKVVQIIAEEIEAHKEELSKEEKDEFVKESLWIKSISFSSQVEK